MITGAAAYTTGTGPTGQVEVFGIARPLNPPTATATSNFNTFVAAAFAGPTFPMFDVKRKVSSTFGGCACMRGLNAIHLQPLVDAGIVIAGTPPPGRKTSISPPIWPSAT